MPTKRQLLINLMIIFSSAIYLSAEAAIIDPEQYILKYGYHSLKIGDDKKTKIYSYKERVSASTISELTYEISNLPKTSEIYQLCDFWRGLTKSNLIEQRGIETDVVVSNYGHSGTTITCALKYIRAKKVGNQFIFYNKSNAGLYFVFITD
jgi:hypothetical protein